MHIKALFAYSPAIKIKANVVAVFEVVVQCVGMRVRECVRGCACVCECVCMREEIQVLYFGAVLLHLHQHLFALSVPTIAFF